ncbi:MAG TPA: DUF5681 domain-containing protein [Sphingopyxis sp.]|uniref:DUF5681 domain-containing protein n=1 Tax=Sphingopyxis sp. TaxID=1908224 RepID=UPI002C718A25|nr:DUF5681 domain-containing protein [Sphingopyxis sp.]HWW58829.1 DUF5681 domain-containing protein [Sphingopyxis sp.]
MFGAAHPFCPEIDVSASRRRLLHRGISPQELSMDDKEETVGYGKPPKKHRFKKGQSGNPAGRPPKPKLANDLRSMLDRIGNEEVDINGRSFTLQEVELMALQRKAAKGDVAASRHLAKLRADAGVGKPETLSGVLVVPGKMPLEQWSAAAAIQQSKYRVKNVDDELG